MRPAALARNRRRIGLAAAIVLVLAGCGGNRSTAAVCPESGIIHGLDRLVQRTADGGELRVYLENIDGLCTYERGVLTLDMSVDIVADAPPGTTIPYFVVITDAAGELLDKAEFTATVPADAGSRPVRLREQLQQRISDVAEGTASRHSVLFGLDLPPAIAIEQRRTL